MQHGKRHKKQYAAQRMNFVCISRLHTSFYLGSKWPENSFITQLEIEVHEANVTSSTIVLPARTLYLPICIEFNRSFDIFACLQYSYKFFGLLSICR